MIDEGELRRKAKRRKYLHDQRCDMSVGWKEDLTGAPVITMCDQRPVRFFPEFGLFGCYLCDEHFEHSLAYVGRNN